MSRQNTRRDFLKTTAATGTILGLGDLAFLKGLNPVSAAETKLNPSTVRLNADIEPVVRLIEDTPKNQLLEVMAEKIRKGLTYREVLAGLLVGGSQERGTSAFGGVQISCGACGELGALGELGFPGGAPLAADFLGLGLLQNRRGPRCRGAGRLDDVGRG